MFSDRPLSTSCAKAEFGVVSRTSLLKKFLLVVGGLVADPNVGLLVGILVGLLVGILDDLLVGLSVVVGLWVAGLLRFVPKDDATLTPNGEDVPSVNLELSKLPRFTKGLIRLALTSASN